MTTAKVGVFPSDSLSPEAAPLPEQKRAVQPFSAYTTVFGRLLRRKRQVQHM